MNDVALHLTERALPEVPVRQWVCSLPWQLRYLLGYDRVLCAAVLRAISVELSRSGSGRLADGVRGREHGAERGHRAAELRRLSRGDRPDPPPAACVRKGARRGADPG